MRMIADFISVGGFTMFKANPRDWHVIRISDYFTTTLTTRLATFTTYIPAFTGTSV